MNLTLVNVRESRTFLFSLGGTSVDAQNQRVVFSQIQVITIFGHYIKVVLTSKLCLVYC